jgi:transcriptional regulator with XRE-family HTH domain
VSGLQVRQVRERLGLTQQQAARRWKLSQAYLSLMEGGQRRVPDRLARRLVRTDPALVTALPLDVPNAAVKDLPTLLGALGYPGFEYLTEPRAVANPAAVVLAALTAPSVPARVTEALPWVLVKFPDLAWDWLVAEAKLANAQNRLGYLVSLARQVAAATSNNATALNTLDLAQGRLEDARLAKEDTLGRDVSEVERQYLRQRRPESAAHWNLLTTLSAADLRYVP